MTGIVGYEIIWFPWERELSETQTEISTPNWDVPIRISCSKVTWCDCPAVNPDSTVKPDGASPGDMIDQLQNGCKCQGGRKFSKVHVMQNPDSSRHLSWILIRP